MLGRKLPSRPSTVNKTSSSSKDSQTQARGEVLDIVIYHNPRCSKSRKALELLRSNNIEPEVVEYLKTPPSRERLTEILDMLDVGPRELIRSGESAFKENGLNDADLTDDDLIDAMLRHPVLIQRPIVVADGKAAVGRPPEKILDIL